MDNRLKEKLEQKQKIIGTMFQLGCSTAVECLGISGLDFFIIDTEHAPVSIENVRLFIMASELRNITPLVRLKRISRDTILHALDIGAGGLVAPGVETIEEVNALVEYAKYPPDGTRGFGLTRTSAYGYDESAKDTKRYFEHSNREVLILPQCESKACLAIIEEIAGIKGVDGIFIGPYDLSVSLGKPGNFDTPEFIAAVRKVIQACHTVGKYALIFSSSPERSRAYMEAGFDGIVFNTDADMFINTYKQMLTELRMNHHSEPLVRKKADIFSDYLSQRTGSTIHNEISVLSDSRADLALVGGILVLPETGPLKSNLYIKDGRISGISVEVLPTLETIDVLGKYIFPGIIDPHTHFGIATDFENDLHSETLSAAVGGITTVGCFISSQDARVGHFPDLVEKVSRLSYTDMVPHFVISTEEQLGEIPVVVKDLGVRTFKVYLNGIDGLIPSKDDGFVIDVMENLKKTGIPCLLFVHCENDSLVRRATRLTDEKFGMNATIVDWEETHPAIAEEEAIMRVAFFAKKYKQPTYIVHISSAEGADMIKKIKVDNPYIYAETTSPYLTVTADQYATTEGLMVPPLRRQSDQDRLWESIKHHEIDTIGTDNVAMTLSEKGDPKNVWKAFPGYPALATHFLAVLNEGWVSRGLAIEDLIVPMTKRPAELLGLYPRKGTLMPGSDADIVVIDKNFRKTVDVHDLYSRADFSLYEGKSMCCWPVMTIKNGIIVALNGKPTGEHAQCQVIVSTEVVNYGGDKYL